jgi:Ca2+/Na+ antiporter
LEQKTREVAVLERNRDMASAALFVGLGLFALFRTEGFRSAVGGSGDPLGPTAFPAALGVLMIVLGAALGLKALLRPAPVAAAVAPEADARIAMPVVRLVICVGVISLYAFALTRIPLVVSTFVFLAVLFVLFGQRRPVAVGAVSAMGAVLSDVFFLRILGLPL